MTKSTGKSSSAIDAAETKVTTAKRAVSMAAESARQDCGEGRQAAAKTAVKKAAKTAAADKPEKATKTRAKKAEDKLADAGQRAPGPSGRRPGRPAKNANNDSDGFDDPMDGEGEVLPDLKPPKRGGKRGKADPKDLIARGPVSAEEYEARRNRLKQLIKLGKDRGYMTYGEINDHLPDDLVDAEAIDGIISTFSDMGIAVYDQAPDAETLLMSENAPVASNDDDVEDEAEAALTTVDSDFGRTTDPVRMYMREMGSVELLTREGEIEIAKRIEDGLKHMVMAISACRPPSTKSWHTSCACAKARPRSTKSSTAWSTRKTARNTPAPASAPTKTRAMTARPAACPASSWKTCASRPWPSSTKSASSSTRCACRTRRTATSRTSTCAPRNPSRTN